MSFPMYDLPVLREANGALLAALKELVAQQGVDPARSPITQVCGYPLQTAYRGQFSLVGVPWYGAPGCDGPSHRAFIVVSERSPATSVKDLRGGTFAVNSMLSNTGMNLPRHLLAPLAEGARFFNRVIVTGSHRASMEAVAAGAADAAAIDCVTFALHVEYEPASVKSLRIVTQTSASPTIPFVTSRTIADDDLAALQEALRQFSTRAEYAPTLQVLGITRIDAPGEAGAYDILLEYQAEAVALGYPLLT